MYHARPYVRGVEGPHVERIRRVGGRRGAAGEESLGPSMLERRDPVRRVRHLCIVTRGTAAPCKPSKTKEGTNRVTQRVPKMGTRVHRVHTSRPQREYTVQPQS